MAGVDAITRTVQQLWDELGEGTVRHITAVLPDDYAIFY